MGYLVFLGCRSGAALAILAMTFVLEGCASPAKDRVERLAGAQQSFGAYSQGVVSQGFLFTAGTSPRDAATGRLLPGDMTVQTGKVLDNLEVTLRQGGASLSDVLKLTVYVVDLGDFEAIDTVMAGRFGTHRPSRSIVQVAALRGGARIYVDAIAKVNH